MKILLVHNFYGTSAPSGENKVFEAERAMLEKYGEEVDVYTRHSDEIRVAELKCGVEVGGREKVEGGGRQWKVRLFRLWGLIKGAGCTVGNPCAARALKKKIREFKPDVVHFHNQFPLISPLAIRAAHKCGAKVVMTLHNYRLVCAAGIPMRGNCVCDACFCKVEVEGGGGRRKLSVLPALKYRCYRNSLFATLPLAINIWLYRHCWAKWVDNFIVLSEFQKKIMIACGLPAEKLVVKGNFIPQGPKVEVADGACLKKDQIVYVGRLSPEKGVETLIRAFKLMGGGVIEFMGLREKAEVRRIMREAKVTILPSEWWETFGLTVIESMQEGTPVVVSQLGALGEIVK